MAKFIFQAGVFFKRPLYPANTSTVVTVYDAETGSIAPIWNDRAGADPRANPGPIWQEGQIKFYVDPGRYNIVASNGSDSKTWNDVIIVDPDSGGGGGGTVDSIVPGYDTDVDDSDPANPVVSSAFSVSSTASSYTLSEINDGQWIDITGSGTVDITCPPSVTLDDRFVHIISNYSSGTVTIVAGPGVTVRPPPGGTLIIPQYATVGIKKAEHAADTYIVFGPTEAAA